MKECPVCKRCFPDHVNHCPSDGDATTASLAGEPILDGRYQLENRLGQGGMGVVFKARHIFLKTAHAIKVILPDLVGNDPMLVTRFRQEALAAAAIRHPNIIAVTDFGVARGTMPFLVMEFVQGKSLHELLVAEKSLSPSRALEIMSAIGAGVAAAHRLNIVHRDLKPLNIMMQDQMPIAEGLKILDFGLAKIKSGDLLGSFVQAKTSGSMGSPFYMAPEQWSDEKPDERADIYSLGVIMYQMLAGDVPFKGTSIPSVMKKHLTMTPTPFAEMGVQVPSQVEVVVRRALEKEAINRPDSVDSFIRELRHAVAQSPSTPPRTTQATICDLVGTSRTSTFENTAMRLKNSQHMEAQRLQEQIALMNESTLRSSEALKSEQKARDRIAREEVAREEAYRLQAEAEEKKKGEEESLPLLRKGQEAIDDSPLEFDDHLTFHLREHDQSASESDELPDARVVLRHSEFHNQGEEHIFEEFVLHENYERLWRSLIHAKGGCNLLTGYGRFGGTSLVACAVVKARTELQRAGSSEAALLVFNFEIKNETRETFEIEATKFGFGRLNSPADVGYNSDFEELKNRAGASQLGGQSSVFELPLDQPIGATFFKPFTTAVQTETNKRDYYFSDLLADLNEYFRQKRTTSELRHIVLRLIKSTYLPSRVVFIIDRIAHLETLETLARSEFFSNKRIRVIVVSREEDFDRWQNANPRLETIGFTKWYVPCLWKIDNSDALFSVDLYQTSRINESFNLFLKHLEYKGRGSLGNIISELRQPVNINYGSNFNYIDLEELTERSDIQHSAWMQDVLDLNWTTILSDLFGGLDQEKKTDRARIGVYYLIDWISHKTRFSKPEVFDEANTTRVTISDDNETTIETINSLLLVLVQNKYLRLQNDAYRVIWHKNSPPKCRRVNVKRRKLDKDNLPVQEPATGFRQDLMSSDNNPQPDAFPNLIGETSPNLVSVTQTSTQDSQTDFSSILIPATLTRMHDAVQESFPVHSIIGSRGITSPSKKVFISYSHAEKVWLKRLRVHLRLIERQGLIELWDDTRIATGSSWKEEIKNAISSAKIAILLVSANFLASDFIVNDELPPLLAASKTNGTIILPLIVSPCMFLETNLSQFQAFNAPTSPLSSLRKNLQEELLVKAAKVVTQVVLS
jgi:serine/threonine-protein kinase